MTSPIVRVFVGTVIHSKTFSELEILRDRIIGVDGSGSISFVEEKSMLEKLKPEWSSSVEIIEVPEPQFIIPGFIDTHIHAPQYSFTGTGYDLTLLNWLETYTFPAESKLSDNQLATKVYTDAIQQTLSNGTTTACYYATIDLEATKILVELLYQAGQRALVGKVNMDRNSPDYYVESTASSMKDTRAFVDFTTTKWEEKSIVEEGKTANAQVLPILTPRFVPSCTPELMKELGDFAKEKNLHIQSHISENKDEISWVKSLHPDRSDYSDVYNHFGLLTDKTIMGHGVYLSDEELDLFHKQGASVSHCPISNFAIRSGIFNTRKALAHGVKVGLGTDVSGGYSPSILEVMRQAVIASTSIYFAEPQYAPLTYAEVFYLATRGSAETIDMSDKLGSIEVGKSFDALIIDPACPTSQFHTYDFVANEMKDIFQKFVFLGNANNIKQVFVQGGLRLSK